MEKVTLTLTLEEVQKVGQALVMLPYGQVVDLLSSLQSQINSQIVPQSTEELEEE